MHNALGSIPSHTAWFANNECTPTIIASAAGFGGLQSMEEKVRSAGQTPSTGRPSVRSARNPSSSFAI